MVSIYSIRKNTLVEPATLQVELRGLSTDTKPTKLANGDIENGSVFIAIDTQEIYLYDAENEEWLPEEEQQEDSEVEENNNKSNEEQREVKEDSEPEEVR